MRRLLVLCGMLLIAAPRLAAAQETAAKPRRLPVVPASAAGASATPPTPVVAAAPARSIPPLRAFGSLSASGAPQCRAQCAERRYSCVSADSNGDGGDCSTQWSQCVTGCGGTGYRYSSTSPQVFSQTFAPR